jgi:hypothetical protein
MLPMASLEQVRRSRRAWFPLSIAFFSLLGVGATASQKSPDHEFFLKEIQPILADHCYKCHSHSSDRIKGGLVVDSRDGLITGGDGGAAVVPGDPDKSLLIEAIRYDNDDLQMPPKGKKLTDQQIAVLTEWVKRGAPWPEEPGKKASRPKGRITDEDRQWWSFQPLANPEIPEVADGGWSRNEIDRFVYQRLEKEGLKPAGVARPEQLIRRYYFDLIGLPPTPEEVDAFVEASGRDSQVAAAEVVDRLLASPRYGERWARHWLDLVRYAESDGFRVDDYRPHAWRYRDYVIRAFNEDKPYNRFVAEQIAGDEIAPEDLDARTATGFLRHWIYEYNNRDAVSQWGNILNDITDVTADVFMGMGLQCARCHDHKFDPILQKDYYRLQAFFAPLLPRDDLMLAKREEIQAYEARVKEWEDKTADLRRQIFEIEQPHKLKAAENAIKIFPPETQVLIRKPTLERSPYEHQVAELAYRQIHYEYARLLNRMRGADKDKLVALYKQLSAFDADKPQSPPPAFAASDVGPTAPAVFIPKKQQLGEVEPGFLTILEEAPAKVEPVRGVELDLGDGSTGRRKALAEWLTRGDNPLTTRVIVNRIWQYHFGRGIVGTSSDFGKIGETPSHPELLDWLALRFVKDGWSFKKMHRLILLSATYQQSIENPIVEQARLKDPENRLLWKGSTRRLDAEQIRDSILATTGELDLQPGGEGVSWDKPRRTIYTKVIRNTRDPLLDVFDAPEGFQSTSQRNATTTPTQSLLMINSQWSLTRARAFASRVKKESLSSDVGNMVADAYRLAFGRQPKPEEQALARGFIEAQTAIAETRKPESKTASFLSDKIAFRDGRGALIAEKSEQDRLVVPSMGVFPGGDFTAEAFITLKSLYPGGEVRTILSQWDGKRGHPGWSLGVTSKGSRYKPQTLVLLLSGDQPFSDQDPVEPLFSGIHIELGKPYFVAVSVNLDDATEKGVTFYCKDLSNDDEPMQVSQVKHKVLSGIKNDAPLTIGARGDDPKHVFDGVIDDVRVSNIPLPQEQLLLTRDGVFEHTVGYWKFENDPGVYIDSTKRGGNIVARTVEQPKVEPQFAALIDFCQVLLNSNEFLYID